MTLTNILQIAVCCASLLVAGQGLAAERSPTPASQSAASDKLGAPRPGPQKFNCANHGGASKVCVCGSNSDCGNMIKLGVCQPETLSCGSNGGCSCNMR